MENDLLVVSPGVPSFEGSAASWFEQQGLRRRVAASAPSFFSALEHLRESDLMALMPRRLLPCEGLFEVPLGTHPPAPVGMSPARVDAASGFVLVSGQAEGAIGHLATVLNEAGSALDHVLQRRVRVRGELADVMAPVVPVRARHFDTVRPALTGIGVASLASRDMFIEIEALARVIDRQ